MLLEVNNTAPITVSCSPSVVMGVIPGTVKVLVQLTNNSTVEAFTLNAVSVQITDWYFKVWNCSVCIPAFSVHICGQADCVDFDNGSHAYCVMVTELQRK